MLKVFFYADLVLHIQPFVKRVHLVNINIIIILSFTWSQNGKKVNMSNVCRTSLDFDSPSCRFEVLPVPASTPEFCPNIVMRSANGIFVILKERSTNHWWTIFQTKVETVALLNVNIYKVVNKVTEIFEHLFSCPRPNDKEMQALQRNN